MSRIWQLLAFAALAYFTLRGPLRAVHDSGDFLTVFAASRCWLHGVNPYEIAYLAANAQSGGAQVSPTQFLETPSLYPPPALLLFSPLALLPWTVAKAVWIFCSLCSIYWAGVALVRMAKGWTLPIWTVLLAFAPVHTGISKGQPSVVVCALIILSLATTQPYIAGVLLGLAICIKPQLAVGFLLLALGLREGRKFVAACATGLFVSGVSILRLEPGSITDLVSNLSAAGSAGGINSSSVLNPAAFQLVNIDTLIPASLYSVPVVAIVYLLIALVSVYAVAKTVDLRLAIAVVAAATVLVGYHRFYDAEMLWLCVPPMFATLSGTILTTSWIGFAVFLIPGQTLAAKWLSPHAEHPWSFLLMHHETLALLVMWLIFVGAATNARRSACKPVPQEQSVQKLGLA